MFSHVQNNNVSFVEHSKGINSITVVFRPKDMSPLIDMDYFLLVVGLFAGGDVDEGVI
jgi:hypothetical protein